MSDSPNFEPPEPADRPLCSNCGWTMWIARIERHETGAHERTYRCHRCELEEIKIAKI